jgi:RNA polymerase sigma-70 factor (ECF subfamily)
MVELGGSAVNNLNDNLLFGDSRCHFGNASEPAIRAIAGDRNAREQLFKMHAGKLYRTAFAVLGNKEDTEDALQESWFRAYGNLKSFEGRSSFSTWLTRIVINSALMILRKNRNVHGISIDALDETENASLIHKNRDASPNPEQSFMECERKKILSHAICALPPRIRAVVEFGQLQDLSLKETARALDISVEAAKGRLFHARAALRKSAPLRAIRKPKPERIIGTTVPKECNYETAIYSGLVSYSANTPSVDGLSGDSIRTVANAVNTLSGVVCRGRSGQDRCFASRRAASECCFASSRHLC